MKQSATRDTDKGCGCIRINEQLGLGATSVAAITARMKAAGREMSRSDTAAMAKESKAILLQRLHIGGQHMLPPTMSEAEIRSLVAYLEQPAEIPGAEKNQIAVKESSYRIGRKLTINLSIIRA